MEITPRRPIKILKALLQSPILAVFSIIVIIIIIIADLIKKVDIIRLDGA